TFRMGPFGGSTHHYAPVDLNSLLYRYERDLHDFAARLGLSADAKLWAGAASPAQAASLRGKLPLFERKGGLQMSDHDSGAQWDAPFGWAPTNWLAIKGLDDYGFHVDARRLADKFTGTIDRSFAADGTIREKYNMASGDADVKISAGYKANVI